MRKTSRNERLSSTVNPRFDLLGPRKEYENCEKRIDQIKKDTQKNFEWEKKQLTKRLDTLPSSTGLEDSGGTAGRGTSVGGPSRKTSTNAARPVPIDGKIGLSSAVESFLNKPNPNQAVQTSEGTNRQTETLKQLKFLYETAVALVANAEHASKMSNAKQTRGEEQAVDAVEDNDSKKTQRPSRSSQPRNFAELRTARFSTIDKPDDLKTTPRGSVVADDDRRTSTATGPRQRHMSMVTPEFVGPPSQAVQLISMIRVLTLGEPLKAKQMKALTAVLEESRIAVKAVKGNADPDRSQERLIKRLTELLELVRPQGAELTIKPEEILNCSYLRLTKDNIQRLEGMLRDQGFEPGIHCHSDVKETPLMDLTTQQSTSTHLAPLPQKEKSPRETMSVYMTKAGTPLEKKRVGKPDSVAGPSEDDEHRMKKFRAT
ncbi:uncharacterized protein [Littorina saxatilis]|uniref:Uncharacterized protein n=1 Tax=Littorina saxatilis TaxID=31220 RepID=A0AAN9C072_9CAEN